MNKKQLEESLRSVDKRQILIEKRRGYTRVGMVEDRRLSEVIVEHEDSSTTVGNIYWSKVLRIVPGLQASFIDIGKGTDGFLHFSDVGTTRKDYSHIISGIDDDDDDERDEIGADPLSNQPIEKTSSQTRTRKEKQKDLSQMIASKLNRGDMLLTQVIKEPIGTKGYRLTSDVTIAGRFVVLLPFGSGIISISKRINDRRERRRLRSISKKALNSKNLGLIIRTVAEDQDEEVIRKDIEALLLKWKAIENSIRNAPRPMLVYQEEDVISGTLRDYLDDDVDEIVTNSSQVYKQTLQFLKWAAPSMKDRLRSYKGRLPLFDAYGLGKDMASITSKKIWLKSGGYLIIEHTEAMVVIDVNSGKYTAKKDQEENSLRTNLEAAQEIAHQLRLRDIGGIIVIDFIDLLDRSNSKKVFEELRRELKKDRARSSVLPMSEFGVAQITRERIRPSLTQRLRGECPTCEGSGSIQPKENTLEKIEKWIRKYALSSKSAFSKLQLRVNPETLKNPEHEESIRRKSLRWFAQHLVRVKIRLDETMRADKFQFYLAKEKKDITSKIPDA